jgi:hypothetical protein
MQVVRFLPQHLLELVLQPAQADLVETIRNPAYGVALALAGPCFTVMLDGRPVACAGVDLAHAQRGEVWALLSQESGAVMRRMTRAAAGYFATCGIRRLEVVVATDFAAGNQWARMLGFQLEAPMRGYLPDGATANLYARVQP